MESDSFGLPDEVVQLLQHYFASQPAISEVRVYGSRAMGTYKPGSDIDLAVMSTRDMAAHVKEELEELPTPYLYDVTDYNTISYTPLREHIDRVGKVLYKKEPLT